MDSFLPTHKFARGDDGYVHLEVGSVRGVVCLTLPIPQVFRQLKLPPRNNEHLRDHVSRLKERLITLISPFFKEVGHSLDLNSVPFPEYGHLDEEIELGL